ncbi:hypothetical protein [Acinetobacter bereziniae]
MNTIRFNLYSSTQGMRTENLTKEDEVDGAIIKDLMLEWITTVK